MVTSDLRKYGLTPEDRAWQLRQRFGPAVAARIETLLTQVRVPSEQLLGAIVFLTDTIEDVLELVTLANDDPQRLLNAATVKDERG